MTDGARAAADRAVSRARHAASAARMAAAHRAHRDTLVRELFAQPTRDRAGRCVGRPVSVLRAGLLTPLAELGLDQLRAGGFEITVLTVDEDAPQVVAAATAAERADDGPVLLGDLRTVPIPARSFDIVHCVRLLDRIGHAELVLDRFVAALRPGGVLLLCLRDRDCAAARLQAMAPGWARRALWSRLYPGRPGPFPDLASPVAADRGLQDYAHRRGLLISQRETVLTCADGPDRVSRGAAVARRTVARLSRGRATAAYDEVLYVIRKPEDRFARVV